MKLYHHSFSSNARRVRMAAIALGTLLELELVDLQKGEQKSPDYFAINPNGRVPTLVDGDLVLWESLAIMQYLADVTPGQKLMPTELPARAHAQKWLYWTASHWSAAAAQLNFENFLKARFGLGEPNAYAVERAQRLFRESATTLDRTLARAPWVTGETLTLVDLAIAAPLMYVELAKLPIAGLENVERWFARIRPLDAWKQTEPPR